MRTCQAGVGIRPSQAVSAGAVEPGLLGLPPAVTLMKRTHSHPRLVRFVLAVATAAWCGVTVLGTSGPAGSSAHVVGTPLPPGWELCIAQGLGAPVTPVNVADLDAWQAAEGGSTNNTAANNPFNTRRTTDVDGNPLPMTSDVDGFPAYTTWLAGCAATVATIEQPNMSSIVAALKAGDVSPPGAFLAAVDQSAWCAPSDGQPCYLSDIVGSATTDAVPAVLTSSSALEVYGNVQSDIHDYELAVLATSVDQQTQLAWHEQLDAAQSAVSDAQRSYDTIERKLGRFAVAEYVNSGMFENSAFLGGDGAEGPNTAAVQQYTNVTGANLVARTEAAATLLQSTPNPTRHRVHIVAGQWATLSIRQRTGHADPHQAVDRPGHHADRWRLHCHHHHGGRARLDLDHDHVRTSATVVPHLDHDHVRTNATVVPHLDHDHVHDDNGSLDEHDDHEHGAGLVGRKRHFADAARSHHLDDDHHDHRSDVEHDDDHLDHSADPLLGWHPGREPGRAGVPAGMRGVPGAEPERLSHFEAFSPAKRPAARATRPSARRGVSAR